MRQSPRRVCAFEHRWTRSLPMPTRQASVQFGTACHRSPGLALGESMDRAEVKRLRLHVERALLAQSQLRVVLAAADTTVADGRRNLRNLKARIARRVRASERTE
jgi:hypothetical protein